MDALSRAEQLHLFKLHAGRVYMGGIAEAVNVIHALFFTRAADAALVKTPAFTCSRCSFRTTPRARSGRRAR